MAEISHQSLWEFSMKIPTKCRASGMREIAVDVQTIETLGYRIHSMSSKLQRPKQESTSLSLNLIQDTPVHSSLLSIEFFFWNSTHFDYRSKFCVTYMIISFQWVCRFSVDILKQSFNKIVVGFFVSFDNGYFLSSVHFKKFHALLWNQRC